MEPLAAVVQIVVILTCVGALGCGTYYLIFSS
jgi:hypothetical protein